MRKRQVREAWRPSRSLLQIQWSFPGTWEKWGLGSRKVGPGRETCCGHEQVPFHWVWEGPARSEHALLPPKPASRSPGVRDTAGTPGNGPPQPRWYWAHRWPWKSIQTPKPRWQLQPSLLFLIGKARGGGSGGTPCGPGGVKRRGRTGGDRSQPTPPLRPPFLLRPNCGAKHFKPRLAHVGRTRALHYTPGLHPEKRLVSRKIHFEATFEKAHLYLPMCSTWLNCEICLSFGNTLGRCCEV